VTGAARRYAAPWVLPVDSPPIADGAVLILEDGRLGAVGPEDVVPAPPGIGTIRLDGAALIPGLVNTHTHLELTGFDGRLPQDEFPAWIREVIRLKAARNPDDSLAAARQGLLDCWAAGVTTVADTGDSGAAAVVLAEMGGSGIAYHEVFGPRPEQAAAALEGGIRRLEELSGRAGGRMRLGISPHAPYSVSGVLYDRVAEYARRQGLPVAVHVAESEDESRLLADGTGGFARAWQDRGIPLPADAGCTPIAWLDRHGVLGTRTLCVHVVRAGEADLDTLAQRGAAVAHCPRSNRRHGHGIAPLGAMLARGIRVGVGTDSVASLSPLDLVAEARAAREIAGLDAERAFRLITADAARAIGLEGEIGSLRAGKWADLAAVDLPGPVDASRVTDTLLTRPPRAVRLTVLGGREVHRRSTSPVPAGDA
jgi:5-methylthioadenosine/S-adenosylhomocysteine deaminase